MAKGRFVSKQITIDKKVNDLSDPWSMLGFTWMIPHADCEGRLYGDPSVLKSTIFPRQNGNITVEQVEQMAIQWHNAGLIVYYEDDSDRYIQLVNFEKHQAGLRKDREPESIIPEFNPDVCRIIAGCLPDVCGLNRVKLSISKVKLSKGENDAQIRSIQRIIETITGKPPTGYKDIKAMDELEGAGVTKEDIEKGYKWYTVEQGNTFNYYSSIVKPSIRCMNERLQESHKPKKKVGVLADGTIVYE